MAPGFLEVAQHQLVYYKCTMPVCTYIQYTSKQIPVEKEKAGKSTVSAKAGLLQIQYTYCAKVIHVSVQNRCSIQKTNGEIIVK